MKVLKRMENYGRIYGQMLAALCLFCWGTVALAQGNPEAQPVVEKKDATPHEVVDQVTRELLKVVKGGKEALKTDPDKYFKDVRVVMEDAVNFEFIARNVMGGYSKAATKEQKAEFVEVFTGGLVQTYAKGMANYADLDIAVVAPESKVPAFGKVSVIQKITGPDGVNRVAYTMARRKGDQWKLINVVLDGVNLGKTFRTQFAQAVKQNKGDIGAAIAGWSTQI